MHPKHRLLQASSLQWICYFKQLVERDRYLKLETMAKSNPQVILFEIPIEQFFEICSDKLSRALSGSSR
jgi:hypothetical protein